jgi:hypothetical protein
MPDGQILSRMQGAAGRSDQKVANTFKSFDVF